METLPPQPRYDEGSLSYLRVQSVESGEVLANGPVTDGEQVRGSDPLFTRQLAPGAYRLVSFQRPCQGNCDYLDPPADRCAATVRVAAGEVLVATIVLHQAGGCTVRSG